MCCVSAHPKFEKEEKDTVSVNSENDPDFDSDNSTDGGNQIIKLHYSKERTICILPQPIRPFCTGLRTSQFFYGTLQSVISLR